MPSSRHFDETQEKNAQVYIASKLAEAPRARRASNGCNACGRQVSNMGLLRSTPDRRLVCASNARREKRSVRAEKVHAKEKKKKEIEAEKRSMTSGATDRRGVNTTMQAARTPLPPTVHAHALGATPMRRNTREMRCRSRSKKALEDTKEQGGWSATGSPFRRPYRQLAFATGRESALACSPACTHARSTPGRGGTEYTCRSRDTRSEYLRLECERQDDAAKALRIQVGSPASCVFRSLSVRKLTRCARARKGENVSASWREEVRRRAYTRSAPAYFDASSLRRHIYGKTVSGEVSMKTTQGTSGT